MVKITVNQNLHKNEKQLKVSKQISVHEHDLLKKAGNDMRKFLAQLLLFL